MSNAPKNKLLGKTMDSHTRGTSRDRCPGGRELPHQTLSSGFSHHWTWERHLQVPSPLPFAPTPHLCGSSSMTCEASSLPEYRPAFHSFLAISLLCLILILNSGCSQFSE